MRNSPVWRVKPLRNLMKILEAKGKQQTIGPKINKFRSNIGNMLRSTGYTHTEYDQGISRCLLLICIAELNHKNFFVLMSHFACLFYAYTTSLILIGLMLNLFRMDCRSCSDFDMFSPNYSYLIPTRR